MTSLAGYTLGETLYESERTLVLRGHRESDSASVVLKFLRSEHPTLEQLADLRQQYLLTNQIDDDRILKTHALERYSKSFFLVLEDFGARSLRDLYVDTALPVEQFLPIAIELATILEVLQNHSVIHKDIKPSNILFNPETQQVKLADFCIAISLSQEQANYVDPHLLQGSLAYISPEQTGRMNRSLDYRTDFYSLGITFYELLSGRLPFIASDLMELLHAHIAKSPPPLQELNPALPSVLCELVATLMAKNAEDRYQSASGLRVDLERCQAELTATGTIARFPLKTRDRAPHLLIPQKLYGRETEVADLLAAFERVASLPSEEHPANRSEWVLISGYAGIGKTAIVNEVQKPMALACGYFVAGKFDQFMRNVPYAALIQVFQNLIRQLLSETESKLAQWREKLLAALDDNGSIILDIIPELELIIGVQPEVPLLGAPETENRFNLVFRQFVRVFCQPEHPLVIFLDDLQWIDSASSEMIERLITDPNSQHLLLIGAYRDNEVDAIHPLNRLVERVKSVGTTVREISVAALNFTSVQQLIADTLNGTVEPTEQLELSELIYHKTQGNPFFLTQLLKALYAEKLLAYDPETGIWNWDITEIQSHSVSDLTIVELIARNIRKLSPETRSLLQIAACIGNQFNLSVLATAARRTKFGAAKLIWQAIQMGLILPLSQNYKVPVLLAQDDADKLQDLNVDYRFLHDRVQQAAYSLIPEAEKQQAHWRIGRLLLQDIPPVERKNHIFAIANQLNFGIDLLETQSQKDELIEINLQAGQRAKQNTAYKAASNYLNLGLSLLPECHWQSHAELASLLYQEVAEIEFLNANSERAEQLCETALQHVESLLDRTYFYEIQIKIKLSRSQFGAALELGSAVMVQLGVEIENSPPERLDLGELASLPSMQDPFKLKASQLLTQLHRPAAFTGSELTLSIIYTIIALSIEYGNAPASAYGYCTYGTILSFAIETLFLGYQFGQLAVQVLSIQEDRRIAPQVLVANSVNLQHKRESIEDTIQKFADIVQISLNVGDIEYACHAAHFHCDHTFFSGADLTLCQTRRRQYLEFIQESQQLYQLWLMKIMAQWCANLLGEVVEPLTLTGDFIEEDSEIALARDSNTTIVLFYIYLAKASLCYRFNQFASAWDYCQLAGEHIFVVQGQVHFVEYTFYKVLTQLAVANESELSIAGDLEKLSAWAEHAPVNYQHKYALVLAEQARTRGETLAAMDYYDQAIAQAAANNFPQDEAIASERASDFYRALGREKIARMYLIEAYYAYMRWGAIAKLRDFERQHPDIFEVIHRQRRLPISPEQTITTSFITTTSSASLLQALDLQTIVTTLQTVSEEIILDQLLHKLLQIIMESAGAEKVVLVLKQEVSAATDAASFAVQGIKFLNDAEAEVACTMPLAASQDLPISLAQYVLRTRETIVLANAAAEGNFTQDAYVRERELHSVLCLPIVYQSEVTGLIYLENNQIPDAFTEERLILMRLIASQAAISLAKARLYEQVEHYAQNLEVQVSDRTQELVTQNQQLEREIRQRETTEQALSRANRELQRLTNLDSLTQIANRRRFDTDLRQAWETARDAQQPIALIMFDVDYFKRYNDTYGHQAGDRCLQTIAQAIQPLLPQPPNLLARYGGEEFAIILPEADATKAVVVANEVRAAIRALAIPNQGSEVAPIVTVSLGIQCLIPTTDGTWETLIRGADRALYEAKQQGRDRSSLRSAS